MAKEVGIVVCNYNKKDYIINCIQSILDADGDNYDVYVVDNASDDGSVEAIKEKYSCKVTLIENKENLGGAGGFNTGLREVIKRGYPYIMCVDNDVRFDSKNITELLAFLKSHDDVGMVGSKILFMDVPYKIQTMGAMIDYEKYHVIDLNKYSTDDENVPECVYCDYVPACSLMVKAEAVKKVGLMPEENFIYYDDMDWGVRFNLAGYKVAGISAAKIWHKGGGSISNSTFNKYYMFRNRIRFFMKYLDTERKKVFARFILDELYRSVCACSLKGANAMVKTFMYAYDDAIHGITGKAADYKILKRDDEKRFENIVRASDSILIIYGGDYENIGNIMHKLKTMKCDAKCAISVRDYPDSFEKLQQQYQDNHIVMDVQSEKYSLILKMCTHIFDVTDDEMEGVYLDRWQNVLLTEEDFKLAKNFNISKEMFIQLNLPLMLQS